MSLDWLEPVSPVVPARQRMSWTYLDMPESSMCAGTENHWYQLLALDLVLLALDLVLLALDLVHSPGPSCCGPFPFARFHTYYTQIIIIIQLYTIILGAFKCASCMTP